MQLNATSGHTRRRPATSGECLLSSRPQVRILLGAHVKPIFQLLCSPPGSRWGSQSFAPVAAKKDRLGSITPGKLADLVGYPADPLAADPDDLAALTPVFTIVGGRATHDPDKRLAR